MNLEKLDEAIALIERNPELHKQSYWFSKTDGGCGTAYCLAGALALLDGWEPAWGLSDDEDFGDVESDEAVLATKAGWTRAVSDVARDILTPGQPVNWRIDSMFAGGNTLEEIKRLRDQIARGEL
jgi:hypothetical protein